MPSLPRSIPLALAVFAGFASFASGCKSSSSNKDAIVIDGSSTVYPISEAVAEQYKATGKGRVTIGVSGTGGGFKKLCNGEIGIAGASRPIKPTEVELCSSNSVEYIELPIAYDGLAVVVNPENTWVDHLTVAELKKMWAPEAQGTVATWSDIRPEWPAEKLQLFAPGVDSGTYDYFTAAIVGKEHASRGDVSANEDDNVLVNGVATGKYALAFFGYAYYAENKDKLKLVPIDDGDEKNGEGPVAPSLDTVRNGSYQPLSRPIFIYVSAKAAADEKVADFVKFYIDNAAKLAAEVGYIPLPDAAKEMVHKRFAAKTTGSVFGGEGSKVGVTVEELLKPAQ